MHLLIDLQACQSLVHGKRGIGVYARSLVRALMRQAGGRRISFLINADREDSAIELRRELLLDVDSKDIHVWSGPAPRNLQGEGHAGRNEASRVVRDALIASIAPDCVLVLSAFEGWHDDCICSIPAHADIATAVVVYDLIPYLYPDIYLRDPKLRAWYLNVLRSLADADALLAISNGSREEIVEALTFEPSQVLNISAAVDQRYVPVVVPEDAQRSLRTRLKLKKPFVMYTGGVDHRKNIDLLIEAFAKTGSFKDSHQLAIVCAVQPDESKRLHKVARDAGLAKDTLVLTGFVSDEDLLTLYNLCDLFVFPSWHEGFGLPVLEAMSVGAPVVASDIPSLREVVGPEGELFDPRSSQSIADAIARVLKDDKLRDRLARNGIARSKEFSWERSAAEAWKGVEMAVEARRATNISAGHAPIKRTKPTLAYLSPLPPQPSGIADFSAELLPELMSHYDIDLIVDKLDRPIDLDNLMLPVRDLNWFLENAKRYDRVLFHFGNSEYHSHMFHALQKVGGTVALHDFYLGNLHHWLQDTGRQPGVWQRALYEGHGYHALKMLGETADRNLTAFRFPCNWGVVSAADGIIVHSEHSRDLAARWYGEAEAKRFLQIPHLRKVQKAVDRNGSRRALGIDDKQIVVAAFGILSANKCNDSLLEAWLTSFGDRADCKLVFVGRAANPEWEATLYDRARQGGARNVTITGFVDAEAYRHWLAAADISVQLRRQSRGETSGAVLDCLAWGIPTIVNAHGSLAELPAHVVVRLEDHFEVRDLAASMGQLIDSEEAREALVTAGKKYLEEVHDPARVAQSYSSAIEAFYKRSSRRVLRDAIGQLSSAGVVASLTDEDNDALAVGLSTLLGPATPRRQLLLDVSELVRADARSGIQRVVRSILNELLTRTEIDWRIEPVYTSGDGRYRYARQFSCAFLGCPETTLQDDPIDVESGDIFVGLDLVPTGVPAASDLFKSLKARGCQLVFVLYDMLPIAHPEWFPPNASTVLEPWYRAVADQADRVVAISRSVADEFGSWMGSAGRGSPLDLSWFHLGADVNASVPSRGFSEEEAGHLERLRKTKNIVLMVGTIEPRKGHEQALEAFEKLRARDVEAELVIVGKQGWCVEELIEKLNKRVTAGPGVTWFSAASDELLDHLYGLASLLLVASRGEGFGLPIIEGAMRGVTVLARDLPVFREVAGEGVFYFTGNSADDLASAIERSLAAIQAGEVPAQTNIALNSWATSARQFLEAVTGTSPYRTWMPS